MRKVSNRRFSHYVLAVASVLVALAATKLIALVDQQPTLFVFLGAIMISALIGGMLPGLIALGLSAVISSLFVFPPTGSFEIANYGFLIRWIVFQVIGLLIIVVSSSRRGVAERLKETDQRLRLALDAAHVGVWDYSFETGDFWVSSELGVLFSQSPQWFKPTFDEFLKLIHPEDREFFHQAVLRTVADRVDYEVDFRIIRPDGSIHWLMTRGRGYTGSSGSKRIVGVISDNATHHSAQSPSSAIKQAKPFVSLAQ